MASASAASYSQLLTDGYIRKKLCAPGSVVHPLINPFKMHICSRQTVKMKIYMHIHVAALGQIKECLEIFVMTVKSKRRTGLIYNYGS